MTGKVIVFNFDGTGNEPLDCSSNSEAQGDSISNILKLHFLFGGGLHEGEKYGQSMQDNVKASFYYQGIGTYSNALHNALESAFAFSMGDKKAILEKAGRDFTQHYENGDIVLITGFSRGAAIARQFVTIIEDLVNPSACSFVFMCLFDTVTSAGLPNLSSKTRLSNETLYEQMYQLSPIVGRALHMVSIDERRRAFQPNLMNYDPLRVEEIWFPGVHSNIGGGFYDDGLSDVTLSHAIDWLSYLVKCQKLPELTLTMKDVALDEVLPSAYLGIIDDNDLDIQPNEMGHIHYKQRTGLFQRLTLESRKVCVLKNDRIVTDESCLPVIHSSVLARKEQDPDYDPKGLQGIKTRVFSGYI